MPTISLAFTFVASLIVTLGCGISLSPDLSLVAAEQQRYSHPPTGSPSSFDSSLSPRRIFVGTQHIVAVLQVTENHIIAMDVEFVLRMQSNSPHCNESRPPIDENFTRSCVNSEARLPPIAANNVTPDEGYIPSTTNDVWLSSFTTRATIKASTASATNSSINTASTLTSSKKLSTSILDDDMLSLDISDEEIDSFMDDAMEQDDDVLGASCDNFDYKSYPSQGENSDIDTKVQRQEAILITTMQKSAESRAAVQRLGILSTERLSDARKILRGMELPTLASTGHLLSRNEVSSSSWYNYNKDDTMRYDSIVAAARVVLDNS